MALANVAVYLARVGIRVLVVDADLEAPGVSDFLLSGITAEQGGEVAGEHLERLKALKKGLPGREGLIDIFTDFASEKVLDLREFILSLSDSRGGGESGPGSVSLLSSGNRLKDGGQQYINRVASFGYGLEQATPFFKWFRKELKNVADVVLIDSRTGFSEMGGLVTQLLADLVVAFCAPNRQNLLGTKTVVASFLNGLLQKERRAFYEVSGGGTSIGPLDVMVVPSRIDQSSTGARYGFFARKLEAIFKTELKLHASKEYLSDKPHLKILMHNPIPYISSYAFNEKLTSPLPEDRHGSEVFEPNPLSQAYRVLTEEIVDWMLGRMQFDEKAMKASERMPLTHLLSAAPEDIAKARTLQCAVESALDTWFVSLGLFDSFKKNIPLQKRLEQSFFSREPVPIIQLVDSGRDVPVARWSTADLARRFWKRLGKQDPSTISVEINNPLGLKGNIIWPEEKSVYDVAMEIDSKFPRKFSPPQVQVGKPGTADLESDETEKKLDSIGLVWTRGRIREWWDSFEEELRERLRDGLVKRGRTIVELYHVMRMLGTGNREDAFIYFDFQELTKRVVPSIEPKTTPSSVRVGESFEEQCLHFVERCLIPHPIDGRVREKEANLMVLHLFHAVPIPGEHVILRIEDLVKKYPRWGGVVPLVSWMLVQRQFDRIEQLCGSMARRENHLYWHCRMLTSQVKGDHKAALEFSEKIDFSEFNPEVRFFMEISRCSSRNALGVGSMAAVELSKTYGKDKHYLDYLGSYNDICFQSVLWSALGENKFLVAAWEALDECLELSTQLWPEWMEIDPDLEGIRRADPVRFGTAVEQAKSWRGFLDSQ
jgi:hypothetical protein